MRAKAGATRERILDAALDLFVEEGYDKASLRELAGRMGFTKAALYYHFASKSDILMALHQRMHGLLEDPLAALGTGPVSSDSFEKFLGACIDGIQANYKLFLLHRNNQAALRDIHHEGHEGAHMELEERTRSLLSDRSLTPEQRVRMTAAFALAFVSPLLVAFFAPPGEGKDSNAIGSQSTKEAGGRRGAGSGIGERPPAPGGVSQEFVTVLKALVALVLHGEWSAQPARRRGGTPVRRTAGRGGAPIRRVERHGDAPVRRTAGRGDAPVRQTGRRSRSARSANTSVN